MLKKHFLSLINKYSNNLHFNENCWSEIEKKYSEKNRFYHNLTHLENMLLELEFIKDKAIDLDSILFSVYYHDIIYDASKSNNEEKSAEYLEKSLIKTSFEAIESCKNQIIATKLHEESSDMDVNILLDIDMSILGQSWGIYKDYYKKIRKEYNIYPDFLYKKGRKKALKLFLEQNKIFKTDFFFEKYEKQARANILKEITIL
jgi:predicted metal-dependent HD superfamily phosphohydrolase